MKNARLFHDGRSLFLLGLMCLLLSPGQVFAQASNEELWQRVEQMEARIKELESRLAVYESREEIREEKLEQVATKVNGLDNQIKEPQTVSRIQLIEGIEVGAGATFVYQNSTNANGDDLSEGGQDVGDGSYSVDLELAKEFEDTGKALLLFEAGEGAGVEDELKLFSNVNYDATGGDSQPNVIEGWYEHYLGPWTVRGGKLDASYLIDNNDYANDETTQFLGRLFRNNPTVEFPSNSGGIRLALAPVEWMDIETIAMEGDADWEDLGDDPFYAGQVNLKPKLLARPGNCRFFGWGSDRDHTRWDDSDSTKESGYGFGLSFDQELLDHFGVFARYGWQNPKVYLNGESFSLEQSYSLGCQVAGALWKRDNDAVGLAWGAAIPSDDYKGSDDTLNADTEYHLETYYNIFVNDHLSISPDLQVIWNPYGNDAANGDDMVIVSGVRGQLGF